MATTSEATRPGSVTESSATKNVPSRKRGATFAASSRERRVLPVPPGPVRVRSLAVAMRRTAAASSSRPTKDVTWEGSVGPTVPAVRSGGNSPLRPSPTNWYKRSARGRSLRRCSPRSRSDVASGSDPFTSSRVAAETTTWPPWPAEAMRAVSWSTSPT